MNDFIPELGQMAFGQPHKAYTVPDIWEAALSMLACELDRVMCNVHQTEYANPFSNTGEAFKCDAFAVEAYSWNDEYEQPYNFKWKDVEISWYKYLSRGMSANKELPPELAAIMLEDCLKAVRALDVRP